MRLGVEVSEIVVTDGGASVRDTAGNLEHCSHVVVTVPLGVLKQGMPRISPAFPPDRLAAIARLGFGHFEKVALRFETAFWRAAGIPHLGVIPSDPNDGLVWIIGQDAFGVAPSVVCLTYARAAHHVLESTPDQAAEWVLDMLAEALGAPCPAPTAIAVSSWASDRFSGGAYTHVPPGAEPRDADLLGEPIAGRLLFAGEHTQSARMGSADGAMASGIREAKRLLQRPSVRLGPG